MMRHWALAASLAALAAGGCSTVQPWQKEALSKRSMRFGQSRASQPFVAHSLSTIEQAEGGEGGDGGGCGCR